MTRNNSARSTCRYSDLLSSAWFSGYRCVWCAGYCFETLQLSALIKTTHRLDVSILTNEPIYASPCTVYGIPALALDSLPAAPAGTLVLIITPDKAQRVFWQSFCKERQLPYTLFDHRSFDRVFNEIPAPIYLSCTCYATLLYAPDLEHPRTFNEKVNYLKLHGYQPLHSTLTDKAAVKEHVAALIGQKYMIPTLGIYENVAAFRKAFPALPEAFAVKCTHDSGSVQICTDKKSFDLPAVCKLLSAYLKRNYYYCGREPAYRDIPPRLIVEPLLPGSAHADLIDYKFHCVNGEALLLEAISRRRSPGGARATFFDARTLHRYGFTYTYPLHESLELAPSEVIAHMRELCRKLAADLPFVRIDFYYTGGQIYFGEYTLYPASGTHPFKPAVWDFILGDLISPAIPHRPQTGEAQLQSYADPLLPEGRALPRNPPAVEAYPPLPGEHP